MKSATAISTAPPLALSILLLEDRPADAELALRALTEAGIAADSRRVQTEEDFVAALESPPDLILADFRLPQFDGLKALRLVRDRGLDLPFIIVTGTLGDERAAECMRHGVTDYVLKDRLARLGPAVHRALAEHKLQADRRETDEKLRRSEENYRTLFNEAADGIYLSDAEGRLLDANRSGCELFECTLDTMLGSAITDHVVPAERQEASTRIRAASREVRGGTFRFRRRDGSQFTGETTLKALSDGRLLGIVRDVTARETAVQRIRLQADLLSQTQDCIVVTDLAGVITFWNRGAERASGWSAQATVGRRIEEVLGPEGASLIQSAREALARNESWRQEVQLTAKSGNPLMFDLRVTILRDTDDKPIGRLSIATDIAQRKQAEAAQHEAEASLTAATTAAGVGIWDWDLVTGRIVWSALHAELWDVSPDAFRGTYEEFESRVHPQDREQLRAAIRTALEQHTEYRHDFRLVRPDGSVRWISGRGRALFDEANQPRRMTGIVADITAQKKMEEQFLRAQRMENLGLLAAGIAHDMNNILAPIMMIAPLLRGRLPAESDQKLLGMLEQSARRGAGLVKQILTFANGKNNEPGLVQLKHLARDIATMIEETFPRNIHFTSEIIPSLWPALANASQVHQVLLNLCVNARDAMPTGGELRLRVANCELDAAAAAAIPDSRPGRFVLLEVSDTGSGIPPELIERVWEPFFTTKSEGKGTGLGLSTVRGIITRHHGFGTLDSVVGRGTTFRFYLPAEPDVTGPAGSTTPPFVRSEARGETILVVDDEPDVGSFVSAILTHHGYRTLTAKDGEEALEIFQAHQRDIRLVLTDGHMPGLSGADLIAALRRLQPEIRVLLCTGLIDPPAPGVPAEETLMKPFEASTLVATVQRLLHTP